jgi:hypothetical protein
LKTESIDTENSVNSINAIDSEVQKIEKPKCINLNNFNNFGNLSESSSKRRRSLHSTFLLLKKKLNLEQFMRKTQIDSLLKKCKSKAFKTIHEALKKCLNIKLPRLPQQFITNIKIDFNKIYLEKTIYEIYKEYKIIPSIEEFLNKKYLIDDKIQIFIDFLNLTFKNVFEYYVNSKQYVKDYYHIMQREGEKFAILFNYISKVFIQYYTKSKGNKPKNKNKNQSNNSDSPDVEMNGADSENCEKINDNYIDINKIMEFNNSLGQKENQGFSVQLKEKLKTSSNGVKIDTPPTQFKRKPLFKRIKVKRVFMKKKVIKVCEVNTTNTTNTINSNSSNTSTTSNPTNKQIFQIKKLKREINLV